MAIGNAALAQIIRRNFDRNLISDCDFDEEFAHLSGDVSKHFMPVFELYFVHGGGQNLGYGPGDFNLLIFFFRHSCRLVW